MEKSPTTFRIFEFILYYCELFNDFQLTYSNDYHAHFLVDVKNHNVLYPDYQVNDHIADTYNWVQYDDVATDLNYALVKKLDVFRESLGCDFDYYYIMHDKDEEVKNGHRQPVKPHIHLLLFTDDYQEPQVVYYRFNNAFQRLSYKFVERITKHNREYTIYREFSPSYDSKASRFAYWADDYEISRVKYLVHLENKEKAQYDTSLVVGSHDYSTDSRLKVEQAPRDLFDIMVDFINSHPHDSIADIINSVRYFGSPQIKQEWRIRSHSYRGLAKNLKH